MSRTARKFDYVVILAVCAVILAATLLGIAFLKDEAGVADAASGYLSAVVYIDGVEPEFSSIKSVEYAVTPTFNSTFALECDTSDFVKSYTGGTSGTSSNLKTWESLGVSAPTYCFRVARSSAQLSAHWLIKMMDGRTYVLKNCRGRDGSPYVLLLTDANRVDSLEMVDIGTPSVVYNGTDQGTVLRNLVSQHYSTNNFTLGILKATDVGTYIITVAPNKPATWTDGTSVKKEVMVEIKPADINDCEVTQTTKFAYTGYNQLIKASDFTVKVGTKKVEVKSENYTFTSNVSEVKNPGTYEVTFEGTNNLTGTRTVQFTVTKATSLLGADFHAEREYVYNPYGIKPTPQVMFGEDELVLGEDFEYFYGSNSSIGTGTGGGIVGVRTLASSTKFESGLTVETVFDIIAKPITEVNVDFGEVTYTGSPLEPSLTLSWTTDDGRPVTLTPTDWSIVPGSWYNNVNAGTEASVSIRGQNSYSGTAEFKFEIKKAPFTQNGDFEISLNLPDGGYSYDAFAKTPEVKVFYKGDDVSGQFAVNYEDNINAGRATVVVTPAVNGNFEGEEARLNFDISKADLDNSKFQLTYGEAINAVTEQAFPSLTPVHQGTGTFRYAIVNPEQCLAEIDEVSGVITLGGRGKLGVIRVRVSISGDANYIDGSYIECTLETIFAYGYAIADIEGVRDNIVYSTLKAAIDEISGSATIYVKGSSDKLTLGGDVEVGSDVKLCSADSAMYAVEDVQNDADAVKFGTTVNTEGGTITVKAGGKLTLEDVTFSALNVLGIEELADNRSAVVVVDGGTFVVNAGGVAYGQNGGVRLQNGGQADINGGRICFNSGLNGAGIYVERGCTLNVKGGRFTSNTAIENGGAIYVEIDVSVDIEGATFESNSAEAGGAIYFTGQDDTTDNLVVGGLAAATEVTIMSNAAMTNGGGIYIEDYASVTVNRAVADNNVSTGVGDFIYLAGAHSELLLRASDSTVGVTDSIGIGAEAEYPDIPIKVLSTQLTHVINLFFAQEIVDKVDDDHEGGVYVHSDQATAKQLADNFRVINPGYTLVYAGRSELRLSVSKDLVAYANIDGEMTGMASVQDAVDHTVDGTVYVAISVSDIDGELSVRTSVEESITIVISGKQVTFKTVVHIAKTLVGGEQVENVKESFYTISGNEWQSVGTEEYDGDLDAVKQTVAQQTAEYGYGAACNSARIVRATDFNGTLIEVASGAEFTLENVVLDGGAVWSGDYIELEDTDGVAGTVTSANHQGITGHSALVVNKGKFTLSNGGILQNNFNNYQAPGEGFSAQNMGGGLRNEGAGVAEINGGEIRFNYSRVGGAALNINKKYKTGTREQDGGYSEVPPTLTVSGGSIHHNASQRVGSAIDTVYGGAVTNITGGTIEDNYSLYDRGVLSVREGGVLNVSGGVIKVWNDQPRIERKNVNCLLVYNMYTYDDYLLEYTAEYIEGEKAAELNIDNAPQITGRIYLEADCVVYNPTLPESAEYFAPVVHFANYTGGQIDLAIDPTRGYGAVVTTDGIDVDDAVRVVSAPVKDAHYDVSARFAYVTNSGKELALGGYDINAVQTSINEMNISGKFDVAECLTQTLQVAGAAIELNLDTEGNIGGGEGVKVPLEDLDGSVELTVDIAAKDENTRVTEAADSVYTVHYIMLKPDTGYITVPSDIDVYYRTKDNFTVKLESGILPNNARIGDLGNMFLYMGAEDAEGSIVFVGRRMPTPTLADEFGGTAEDLTDTKYIMQGKSGFEYALLVKNNLGNFEFVVGTPDAWKRPNGDGLVVFENLTQSTKYFVTVRRCADEDHIPSEYIDLEDDLSAFETLSQAQATQKLQFETQFEANRSKFITWNDDHTVFDVGISFEELRAIHVLLIGDGQDLVALPDSVQWLKRISEMDSTLRESMTYADAGQWKTQNADALALSGDEIYTAEVAIANALVSYHAIGDNTVLSLTASDIRLQIKAEYDKLVDMYKRVAEKKINDEAEAANSETARAIASTYVTLLGPVVDTYDIVIADDGGVGTSEFLPAKVQIDAICARAISAIRVQIAYDLLMVDFANRLSESAKDSVLDVMADAMTALNRAAEADCNAIETAAVHEMYIIAGKGVVELHYANILLNTGKNGIVEEYLETVLDGDVEVVKSFVDARDQAYADIDAAQDSAIRGIVNAAILKLSREEGKAIIQCYLTYVELQYEIVGEKNAIIADEEETIAVAVEWQNTIDQTALEDIPDTIEKAKQAIEISRAGIYVQTYYNERNGVDGEAPTEYGKELLEEYKNAIKVAPDGYKAWILAEEGRQRIFLESSKQIAFNDLSTDTQQIQQEKGDLIETRIGEMIQALNVAVSTFESAQTIAETKILAADTFSAAVNDKLLAMYEELSAFDRNRFVEDYSDFVGDSKKPVEDITAADLEDINAALADLASTYSLASQYMLDNLRHELLERKKAAVKATLVAKSVESEAAMKVFDSFNAQLENISIPSTEGHSPAEDEVVSSALNALIENFDNATEFEQHKLTMLAMFQSYRNAQNDSQAVTYIFDEVINAVAQLSYSNAFGKEQQLNDVDEAIYDGVARVNVRRFKDAHPAIENGGSVEDYSAAMDAYAALEEELRQNDTFASVIDFVIHKTFELFNGEAGEYGKYDNMLDDMRVMQEFADLKADKIANLISVKRDKDGVRAAAIFEQRLAAIEAVIYERQYAVDAQAREDYFEERSADLAGVADMAVKQVKLAQDVQDAEERVSSDLTEKRNSGNYSDEQMRALEKIASDCAEALEDVTVEQGAERLTQIANEAIQAMNAVAVTNVGSEHMSPDGTPKGKYASDDPEELWGAVKAIEGDLPRGVQVRAEKKADATGDAITDLINANAYRAADGNTIDDDILYSLISGKIFGCTADIYMDLDGDRFAPEDGLYEVRILLPAKLAALDGLQVVYVAEDALEVYDTRVETVGEHKVLVFRTAHFSDFTILADKPVQLGWLIGVLAVLALIEAAVVIWLAIKFSKLKKGSVKTMSFLPIALLGAVAPVGAGPACIALAILVVALGVTIAVLAAMTHKLTQETEEEPVFVRKSAMEKLFNEDDRSDPDDKNAKRDKN